jgi:hypothetical protein
MGRNDDHTTKVIGGLALLSVVAAVTPLVVGKVGGGTSVQSAVKVSVAKPFTAMDEATFKKKVTVEGACTMEDTCKFEKVATFDADVVAKEDVTVTGDVTLKRKLIMDSGNQAGKFMVADGTSFVPVVASGDLTLASTGAFSLASAKVDTKHLTADCKAYLKAQATHSGTVETGDIKDDAVTNAKLKYYKINVATAAASGLQGGQDTSLGNTVNLSIKPLGVTGAMTVSGIRLHGGCTVSGTWNVCGTMTSESGLNAKSTVEIDGNLTTNKKLLLKGSEDVSTGNLDHDKLASYFTVGSSDETSTLTAGTEGQMKTLVASSVTSGKKMTVTVKNAGWKASGTDGTLVFDAIGESCQLQYIDSKWFILGSYNTTVS